MTTALLALHEFRKYALNRDVFKQSSYCAPVSGNFGLIGDKREAFCDASAADASELVDITEICAQGERENSPMKKTING